MTSSREHIARGTIRALVMMAGLLAVLPAAGASPRPSSAEGSGTARIAVRRAQLHQRARAEGRTLGERASTRQSREMAAESAEANHAALRTLGGVVAGNRFNVGRRLVHYRATLGVSFRRILSSLGPEHHWIDMGAGEAGAIHDFLAAVPETEQPRITAIGVAVPEGASRSARYRYLEGRMLADYTAGEIGQADLITDLYGPAVYAGALDRTVEQYGHLLRPGGDVFIVVGTHVTINGVDFRITGPLRRQRSVVVQRWIEASTGFDFVGIENGGVIHLRRNTAPLRVASLRLARVGIDANGRNWRYEYRFTPDHVRPEAALHGNE